MGSDNYASRIKSQVNFDTFEKPQNQYQEVARFTAKQGEMVKTIVTKTKFSQVNGKRFCFPDGSLSSSYTHQSLRKIDEFKKQKGKKIEKYFW